MEIELVVNGDLYAIDVSASRRLSAVLRDDLGLTGTKLGCGEGACGACAVLVDGKVVNSCLVLAVALGGRGIVTIEGLSSEGPTVLQRAFVEEDALQCGFCTPGQIVAATALLAEKPAPSTDEIRAGMSGN